MLWAVLKITIMQIGGGGVCAIKVRNNFGGKKFTDYLGDLTAAMRKKHLELGQRMENMIGRKWPMIRGDTQERGIRERKKNVSERKGTINFKKGKESN